MQYAWLTWSLILLAIWGIIYIFLKSKESRRKMLLVSFWTSLLGLSEPLFIPKYWNPPSLFDLAAKTGFDIESLIFSFSVGGIAAVIYGLIFHARDEPLKPRGRRFLLIAPTIFLLLMITTSFNPIYSAIIAMSASGFFSWYRRPDLKKKMVVSAFIFLGIYFISLLVLIAFYHSFVEQTWNFSTISGILIFGIPLEELLFAFSFGFLWSSVYERIAFNKIKYLSDES